MNKMKNTLSKTSTREAGGWHPEGSNENLLQN
jgi:hypothetical protein